MCDRLRVAKFFERRVIIPGVSGPRGWPCTDLYIGSKIKAHVVAFEVDRVAYLALWASQVIDEHAVEAEWDNGRWTGPAHGITWAGQSFAEDFSQDL